MKKATLLLIGLVIGMAQSGGCMSEPNERMNISKQVRLSPEHRVMPYKIVKAANGDLIIFGSTDDMDHRAWAMRMTQHGEARWEFMEGDSNGWDDKTVSGQRFYGAVDLPDLTTLLCGIKIVNKERLGIVAHIGIDGTLIAERVIRTRPEKGFVIAIGCMRWDDGIAVFGNDFGVPIHTAWLQKWDKNLSSEWEKSGAQFASQNIMEAPDSNLWLLNTAQSNPEGGSTSILRLGPAGEVVARHVLSDEDNPELVYSAVPRASLVLAFLKDTLKTEICEFDGRLRGPTRVVKLQNAGVRKALELSDGSIAIFGSEFHGTATAAVKRVYRDGSSKGFLVEPPHESAWYYDAVQIGDGADFAAVRSVNNLPAVLDWVSFK